MPKKAKQSNRVVQLSSDSKSRKRVLVEFTAAELEAVLSGVISPARERAFRTLVRARKLIED